LTILTNQPEEEEKNNHESLSEPSVENTMDLDQLIEESFQELEEGQLVKGVVVMIDSQHVLVDIGAKSEGRIPIEEFQEEDGRITTQVGDEIEALLVRVEDEDNDIVLSKNKAEYAKVWDEVHRVYREDDRIEGRIVSRVKGGLSVDIGVRAFLPGSQAGLRPIKDLEELIGQVHTFKILKYNRRRNNVVVSLRTVLEEERAEIKAGTLAKLEEGAVIEGVIKNITDYGAFVDMGGIDGLLHVTDISWGRVVYLLDVFKIDQPVRVKVIKFDREKERVSLGLKQMTADPWTWAGEKYPVGTRVMAKVISLADYGAFVEVEEGIEGLVHVSEMSWTRKIKKPSQALSVGDIVEALVLSIEPENKRISLGMKQLQPDPWTVVAEKFPIGTILEGRIKNITKFGVFVGIDEGIDGMIHVSDISWTKHIDHPSQVFSKGDVVQAKVLNIDRDNERFSLGIKQLEPDPWELAAQRYPAGSRVVGTVTSVADFGLFVEVEKGIEGLVHMSEVGARQGKPLRELYSPGDVVAARVLSANAAERKISLSIRQDKDSPPQKGGEAHRSGNVGTSLREQIQHAFDQAAEKVENLKERE
jgi:small subunit ribosomal protein S1